MDVKWAES